MAKTENRLAGGVAGPGPEAAMPDGPESNGGIAGTYGAEGGAACPVFEPGKGAGRRLFFWTVSDRL